MTHSGTPRALHVSVLLAALASTAVSQTGPGSPPAANRITPSDQALSSMQASLAQQQAAVDTSRDSAQSAALRQQHDAIVKQLAPLQPAAEPAPSADGTNRTSSSHDGAPRGSTFFTVPWPGALPLSMPNVQVAPDACPALPKDEVSRLIQTAARKQGVDADLLHSVMKQESAFKPCALSVAGAMGLMQIMPETAEMLSVSDPFDPAQNVDAGAKFLKMMLDRFGGDLRMALAAYNAGPEAVSKAGGVPPIAETLHYVSNILGDLPIAY